MFRVGSVLLALGLMICAPLSAGARVFFSKVGAFEEAFPGAKVQQVNLFLDDADAAFIRANSGVEWKGRLANMYVARKGEKIVGYGYIDTHKVRTLGETVLYVLDAEGRIGKIMQLAFHEPAEYQAPSHFLAQFVGRALSPKLSLKGEIDGLSGATLTSRALTSRARAILALHQRKVAKR